MNGINYACTYAYVHGKSALQSMGNKVKERITEVKNDENGAAEIIAIILVIVILVALVIIFRENIATLFNTLWDKIFSDTNSAAGTDGQATKFS